MADDIPSTALIVHGDYYNTTTLPHEMGHCLGLYHTHHGTVNEGGGDINQCPELVDGSNSIVCGDYVQDTPADPNQWSSSSCAYTGTGTDANGEQYSPDASNLMSYAYNPCRNLFSELQISRLKDFIDNTTILQNVFHSYISSPSIVCTTGDIFKVNNLPPVDSIIWSTGPGLTIFSGQNTNSPVIKAIGNGSTWVGVRLVNDCGNITLPQKTIFAGAPYTPVIDGSNYITCDNELFTEGNNKTVTWSVYGPMQIVGQTYGYRCTIEGTGNGYGWVYATASSECDTTTSELFVEVDCGYLLVFSPNPASGETILSIESTSEKKIVDETIDWELEVYDNTQNLKLKNSKVKGKEYRFNTSGWKEGIYVARVKYDDKILTGKLVVKR
ncbi:MAG: M43 family zinc metalloprotease [Draconibacterium sp.]